MGVDPAQNASASSATANAPSSVPSSSSPSTGTTTLDRKRKRQTAEILERGPFDSEENSGFSLDLEQHEARPQKIKKIEPIAPLGEKRLRRYRDHPPASFAAVYARATTQRFFVLSRTHGGTVDCPEMRLEVSGSTGNIYNVVIARQPSCDCPHALAGNQCKHIIFVMTKVLRAKYEYSYQLALLSDELRDIFAHCPRPSDEKNTGENTDKNRRPVDGDCPICFEEMATGDGKEALVWCKAACGQNIHRQCFDMWAATKRQSHGPKGVTCPYCRSPWEGDEPSGVDLANIKRGSWTEEGYVNVADQLGISTVRDHSTYHSPWRYGRCGYRRRFW